MEDNKFVDMSGAKTSAPLMSSVVSKDEKAKVSASAAWPKLGESKLVGNRLVFSVVLCASIGSFLFGYNVALLNTSLSIIGIELDWYSVADRVKVYGSFVNTSVFAGAAIGAMTGGSLLSIGRRLLILCVMSVFCIGAIGSAVANSFSALLFSRLITGSAVGVISVVVPTYISEMTPAKVRGKYGVFHQLFVTIGIFVGTLLGLAFSKLPASDEEKRVFTLVFFDKFWWRCMMVFGLIPVSISMYLLAFVFKFDTPNYYIEKDQPEDAKHLLMLLNNSEDVNDDMEMLLLAKKDRDVAQEIGLSLRKAIKHPIYRRVIVIGCLLSAFQQLTGINVFVSRSNTLFTNAGIDAKYTTMFTVIMSFVNVVMTFPSMFSIERVGRRILLLFGSIGMLASLAPVAVCMTISPGGSAAKYLAVIGAVAFVVFFAGTYGPVLWVYLFEIYPMEIKKSASGLATAVNWLCSIAVVFASGFLEDRISYILFSCTSILAIILIFTSVLETKGRNLQDSPYMTDEEGRALRINSKGAIV